MPHIFQNGNDKRDYRLDDKPGGWMLVHPLKQFGNTRTITHLARCNACNVESAQTADHGDSIRLAFETSFAHNDKFHGAEPAQGSLF